MLKRGILQGVFSWDVHPPKQPMSLGSSGTEGWVPLRDGRRILFSCPAAVWPQTQQRLAQPLCRQITLNPGAGSGKSVAVCFFLHRIPRWVYLQGSVGGWIPCGLCRHVCRERLLAICCGLGEGSREAQHPPGELPPQQQHQPSCLTRIWISNRGKPLCMVQVCCATQLELGLVGQSGCGDSGPSLSPPAPGSSSLTV